MKRLSLTIEGAYVLEAPLWQDERGYFREWFRRDVLGADGPELTVRQANLSLSKRDVVRGLHYSLAPEGQAKLVTCAWGELVDVLVDVRVGSPTFGTVEMVELNAEGPSSVYLPEGLAHGFCVTSEVAALTYLLSSPYNAPLELEISPFDESLGIAWPVAGEAILTPKDANAPSLESRRRANELPIYVA
ncbi:MAG TPA: dTDP-4-dehydrorhamnose 3,5-epimerase [Acidimicrobiales bacterium]|nr:dTDP-4-dehydrorhamnose 3,5-epimerase [Acidimicrobiales bacterium]